MSSPRLSRLTEELGRFFRDWPAPDAGPVLEKLGGITLTIDALTGACRAGKQEIVPLAIAVVMSDRLGRYLKSEGIPPESLRRAGITAWITLSTVPADKRLTRDVFHDAGGAPIAAGDFRRASVDFTAEIEANGEVYRASFADLKEWPASPRPPVW